MDKHIKEIKSYLGAGYYGECYELANGRVLKIFKIPKRKQNLEKYYHFLEYRNETIIFPDEFITNLFHFQGHISDKAPGKNISDCIAQSSILLTAKALEKADSDIKVISDGGIIMSDIHPGNVFFDGHKISFFDVDEYRVADNGKEEIYYKNTHMVRKALLSLVTRYFTDSKLYIELRKSLFRDDTLGDMFLNMQYSLSDYCNCEFDTLEEYNDYIKSRP